MVPLLGMMGLANRGLKCRDVGVQSLVVNARIMASPRFQLSQP